MLIPLTDLQIIYENIVLELNLSYTSVLIFVAFDTDAVCSLKILTVVIWGYREYLSQKVYCMKFTRSQRIRTWKKKLNQQKNWKKLRSYFLSIVEELLTSLKNGSVLKGNSNQFKCFCWMCISQFTMQTLLINMYDSTYFRLKS